MDSMETSRFWEGREDPEEGFLFHPDLSLGFKGDHNGGKDKLDWIINELSDDFTTEILNDGKINYSMEEEENSITADDDIFPEWMELKVDFSLMDGFDNLVDLLDDPEMVMTNETLIKDQIPSSQTETGLVEDNYQLLASSSVLASPPYSTPSSPEGLVPTVSAPNSPSSQSSFDFSLPLVTKVMAEEENQPLGAVEMTDPVADAAMLASVTNNTVLSAYDQDLNDCLFFLNQTIENNNSSENLGDLGETLNVVSVVEPIVNDSLVDGGSSVVVVKTPDSSSLIVPVAAIIVPVAGTRGRKRKIIPDGSETALSSSKRVKNEVAVENSSPGSSKTVPKMRKERKRIQNKDAATRYRQKKAAEKIVVVGEEEKLMEENKTLKDKANSLSTEITYLKNLMREMFKARGLLK